MSSAGDINPGQFNLFNVVFLDKDYKVIGQLLDKKGSISDIQINRVRWSCLGGHFFCQISKQILFKTEDGETHPLAVNRSVLGGARKVI